MPRAPRSFEPGAIYHLTTHGVDDRPIFRDDIDRGRFVALLTRVQKRHAWRIYAICLMDTHHHLVVSARDNGISLGMRELNGNHSRVFNQRHGRRGALFEARYGDRSIRDDDHLLEAIRYVAMNPVRAGMVERPEDWSWSSYPQLIGRRPPWTCFVPTLVLAHFGRTRAAAVETVVDFVAEAMAANRV
jgi:REP element-mobilizing transposase RayT